MRKIITSILAALGLTSACGQQNYESTDVEGFASLLEKNDVVLLDVRSSSEFAEGHIAGALNIDQSDSTFLSRAKQLLPKGATIAVYCRRGRRSASACNRLSSAGFRCVNLKGGIEAWKSASYPLSTSPYEVDVFVTESGKVLKFHALMHASILMEYDGKEILIDPVRQLGNRSVDYSTIGKADYIFVTHEHQDHFDPEALQELSDSGTRLVTNRRCKELYGSGEVMSNGDSLQLPDIRVEAVAAYNTSAGREQFHPKGRDNGYILTIDGLRIYIAGDTEDIDEMELTGDIDIAFLPCNQPYTMTCDQLVHAAKMIRPKVLFPYHYGQTDVSGIAPALSSEGIDVRIRHYE